MPRTSEVRDAGSGAIARAEEVRSPADRTDITANAGWKSGCGISLLFVILSALFFAQNIIALRPVIPYGLMNDFYPWKAASAAVAGHDNPELFDQVFQFYPWWKLIKDEINAGRMPLWNPYSFLGSPLLANGQCGIFFPLNILNWMLSLEVASLLLAIIRLFVAAVFTFLFLRRLGLLRLTAIFGGTAFAFSRNVIVWLGFPAGNAAILLPAAFWACERMIQDIRFGNGLILALVLGSQLLAGQPQTSLVTLLCLTLYTAIRVVQNQAPRKRSLRVALYYGFAWTVALLLAAVQVLPLLEYLQESAALTFRTQFNIKAYPWYEAVSFVLPDFFGTPYDNNYWGFANLVGTACYFGIVPLLLALLSLRRIFRTGTVQTFWIIALICIGVVYRLPLIGRIASLPVLVGVDTNKYLVAMVLSLVICAACELDRILRNGFDRVLRRAVIWAAALSTAALLQFAVFREFISAMKLWPYEVTNVVIFAAAVTALLALLLLARFRIMRPESVVVCMTALTFLDLFVFGHSVNATSGTAGLLQRPEVLRTLQAGSGNYRFLGTQRVLPPNSSILYRLADIRGYDALTPSRYYGFMSRADTGYGDLSATLQTSSPGVIDRATLFKKEVARLLETGGESLQRFLKKTYYWNTDLEGLLGTHALDAMGVKYILAPPGSVSMPGGYPLLVREAQATVFENPHALPRCYLRDRFSLTDDNKALEMIGRPAFDWAHDLVLSHVTESGALQEIFSAPDPGKLQQSHAEIVAENPEMVAISVVTKEPVVLVLSDLFFPGWEAVLDGKPAAIYAANYAFRAIVISRAGTHNVEFRYRPWSFLLGTRISLVAACGIVALIAFVNMRRRSR